MPLTGKRVLVTRSRQQAGSLAELLRLKQAEPILIPTIEIAPPESFAALDAALQNLDAFDWLIFTSANAVQVFAERAHKWNIQPHRKRIAVIGPATAKAVQHLGLQVDLIPPRSVAESLAESLRPYSRGSRMLLVRAQIARDVLPDTLREAGAVVTLADAYRNLVPQSSVEALQALFASTPPDVVTFTSASTVAHLFTLLETAGLKLPADIVCASIGPVTSAALQDAGCSATVEAKEATLSALVHAIERHYASAQVWGKTPSTRTPRV